MIIENFHLSMPIIACAQNNLLSFEGIEQEDSAQFFLASDRWLCSNFVWINWKSFHVYLVYRYVLQAYICKWLYFHVLIANCS